MKENEPEIECIYRKNKYLEAYSQHTDLRVEADPHLAVGGRWEELGGLQFDFLVCNGLLPHHRILDIGCGTLRGGCHAIEYLNKSSYTGIDISNKAIAFAKQLVEKEMLSEKLPRLIVNGSKQLKFNEFFGEKFDYILAQSVFTHLMDDHISECFENVGKIMSENSIFYFTFNEASAYRQGKLNHFYYPLVFFKSLAESYGFKLQDCSSEYDHPAGQKMLELTLN